MKIENTEVYGFRRSLAGMRNPMNSWKKSDTIYTSNVQPTVIAREGAKLGVADLNLACRLIRGGTEHRKFLRQICIWVDLTLPRYIWAEFDTYKIGVTRNSCSTMHKLGSKNLTPDDFERRCVVPELLGMLNKLGARYRAEKDYDIVREMKALLPEGFLQKATCTLNYEVALTMLRQRHNHRLQEWSLSNPESICSWLRQLPYMGVFYEATLAGGPT